MDLIRSEGAWLLPTRRRPDMLHRFLVNALYTGIETPGFVVIHEPEFRELQPIYEAMPMPQGWGFFLTQSEGFGDKLRELWPRYSGWSWIGLVVDDMVPVTPGWDKRLLGSLRSHEVISSNDLGIAPRWGGAAVFGGDWLRTVGYLYPPGLWHTHSDDLWEVLGTESGTWGVDMGVVIKHLHPHWGNMAPDETHTISYGRIWQDRLIYKDWLKTDRHRAVKALNNLRASRREPIAMNG